MSGETLASQTVVFLNSLVFNAALPGATSPPTLKAVLDKILGSGGIVNIFLFGVAPAVAVIMIAYGGFNRIMAGADSKAVQQADEIIRWAVLGYAAVLAGYLLIGLGLALVGYTGGIGDIFNINFN